jgi:uncharacterized membrane protein YhaH (DUF805 family)
MLGALFGFKGRLSLPGFWEVLASVALIDAALLIVRIYLADAGLPGGPGPDSPIAAGFATWTPWLLTVFTAWSLLAAMVKRCHDRGRSGASVLWLLVPVIGWLWLLVDLFLMPGVRGKASHAGRPRAPAREPRPTFNWDAEPAPAVLPAATAHRSAYIEPVRPPPVHQPEQGADGRAPDEPLDQEHGHIQRDYLADEPLVVVHDQGRPLAGAPPPEQDHEAGPEITGHAPVVHGR